MITYDDRKLESFLLDELSTTEREEIEQRLFSDDAMFARVEELESDLVDAYARGALDADRVARFEHFLDSNPSAAAKVQFARLLQETLAAPEANVVPFSRRHGLAIKGALAAVLVVALVGVPAMLKKVKARTPAAPAHVEAIAVHDDPAVPDDVSADVTATDSAAAAEVSQIAVKRRTVPSVLVERAATLPADATRTVTFVLSTITTRSGGLAELVLDEDVASVTIELPLESHDYRGYNVDVRNETGRSVWTALGISIATIDGAPAVSLDVPATALSTGRHELVLAGVAESGVEEIAYVEFEVRRR